MIYKILFRRLYFLFTEKIDMNDFDNKLLQYDKWHDKDFTKEQLQHHLVECLELLEK